MNKNWLIVLFLLITGVAYSQAADGPAGPDRGICPGGSVAIGGDEANGACYSWSAMPDDPAVANLKTGKISVNPKQTTTYTVTVIGKDFSSISTDKVTVSVLQGFSISIDASDVCDGAQPNVTITTFPTDNVLGDFKKCLKESITLESIPTKTPFGNPKGSTSLKFGPLDENGVIKIENALWYATSEDGCNPKSSYQIKATANLNGKVMYAEDTPELTVSTEYGTCLIEANIILPDESIPDQWFAGNIDTIWSQTNGLWKANFAVGSLEKFLLVKVNNPNNPNSQYYSMIQNEEEYHKKQYEGNISPNFSDLFSAQRIVDELNSFSNELVGVTKAEVAAKISFYLTEAERDEIARSLNEVDNRRCAIEAEAKAAIRASFRATLKCAYGCTP